MMSRRGVPPDSPYRAHVGGDVVAGGGPIQSNFRNSTFVSGEDEGRPPASMSYAPGTPLRRGVPPPYTGSGSGGSGPTGASDEGFLTGGSTSADFSRNERFHGALSVGGGGVGPGSGNGFFGTGSSIMHSSFSPCKRRTPRDNGGPDVFRLDGPSRRSVGVGSNDGVGGGGGGGPGLSESGSGGGGGGSPRGPPYVSAPFLMLAASHPCRANCDSVHEPWFPSPTITSCIVLLSVYRMNRHELGIMAYSFLLRTLCCLVTFSLSSGLPWLSRGGRYWRCCCT